MIQIITITLLLAGGTGSAGEVRASEKGCTVTYAEKGYAFDAKTRWTYFKDVVQEVTRNKDGSATVAFRKSARRYEIPKDADAAFLKAAEVSLKDKSEVHAAVQEGESEMPGDDGPGSKSTVHWIDAKQQHSSCR